MSLRRRLAAFYAASLSVVAASITSPLACSLVVSTSDLSGGAGAGQDGAADTSAADALAADALANEAGGDAGDPDLLLRLSFEDTAGPTAIDTSGKGNNGALKSGASFAAGGIDGSRALELHGLDYVDVASLDNAAFPLSGTLSIWFQFEPGAADSDDRNPFDGWDKNRSHAFIRHARTTPEGEFQMALQPMGDGNYALVKDFTVAPRTWTHVVMTWDNAAGGGALYADGQQLKQGIYERPFVATQQRVRLGEGLIGLIDEVKLYKRALNPNEAKALR